MLSTGSDIKSSLGEPLFLFYDFGYFLGVIIIVHISPLVGRLMLTATSGI